MRILVVDDEALALTSVQRLLRWRGYPDVEICDSGREAIRKIREEAFDIVILDLNLKDLAV